MNNCTICGTKFKSKRKDAVTCSPKCRVTLSRKRSEDVTLKPDEPISVTNKLSHERDLPGYVTYNTKLSLETLQSVRNAHQRNRSVTVTPDNTKYQPENGDVMFEGELLKGIREKGTGTELSARDYLRVMRLGKYREKTK